MLTDGQTDRQTDGRTDRRTSSIHKPELLCNPAKNQTLNIKNSTFYIKKSLSYIKKINFFLYLKGMTVIIFRWTEAYPSKIWTVHCIMRVMCNIHFLRSLPLSTEKLLQLLLII